jgi:hypothetical protein
MRNIFLKQWSSLLFLSILVTYPNAQETETYTVGTFLFTPIQRAEIVQSRQKPDGAAEVEALQRYSGVLRRIDGKNSIWINNKVYDPSGSMQAKIVGADMVLNGVKLRVGDAVDINSGARKELLPLGALHKSR